jgi:hypothetical protein
MRAQQGRRHDLSRPRRMTYFISYSGSPGRKEQTMQGTIGRKSMKPNNH